MADLQVSLAFLLENEAELARALEAEGGKIGRDFGNRLSGEAKKAFDDLVAQAEKAAKDAGVRFSRQDFRFRDQQGKFLSDEAVRQLKEANADFAAATAAIDKFRSALTTTGKEGGQSLNLLESAVQGVAFSLANTLTNAAGAALGSVKGLVNGFLELDGELRLAAAAAGEQGGYERLAGIVNRVGVEAAGTTKQVAELSTSLIRAGFSVAEVERALPGVVRGAEATGTGFESFGNIVGNTLRGFGLEVSETARVVDVLTNTANSSNASIEGLGYTFEYAAPIAKALGMSLEDVAAMAGLMANAGIQGSVAGTGLRTGLQQLQKAAGGASPEVMGLTRGQERLTKVMQMLGVQLLDTNGKLIGGEQMLLRLKASLESLNQADQVSLMNIIFGDEAGSKFLAITNQSTSAITKMARDIRNSTGATDTARTAMQGMGMEVKKLEGTIDSLKNQLGGLIAAGLKPLLDLANGLADKVSGLPSPVRNTVGALVALAAAATAASVGIAAFNIAAAQLGGWAALRTAVVAASAAITGPLAAGLVVVLGAAAAVGTLTGSFRGANEATRTLVQTAAGLGAAVLVLRGGAIATAAWTVAMNGLNAAFTFFNAISAKSVIGLIAAAGVAAAAYFAAGKAMEATADKTQDMSERQRQLKDEISETQQLIEKQKGLNIDTTLSEQKVARLQLELSKLETPLQIRLDIQKAEAQIKELEQALKKAQDGERNSAGFLKKPTFELQAQLDSAKEYKAFLEKMDSGGAMTAFSEPIQRGAEQIRSLQDKVKGLSQQRALLPVDAKVERDQIDKEIEKAKQIIDGQKTRVRLQIDEQSIQAQLLKVRTAIAAGRATGSRLLLLSDQENVLFTQLLSKQSEIRSVAEAINVLAESRRDYAKEEAKAKLEQLEAQRNGVELEQTALGLARERDGVERNRLSVAQQAADAVLGLASAQSGFAQSGFDVERSRVAFTLSAEEQRLQRLQASGASVEQIAAAERNVAAIKREQEAIDQRAMRASIDATTVRLELERRVLDLKQAMQAADGRAAINQAQSDFYTQQQRLLELQIKAADPQTKPEQQGMLQQQIELQRQSIQLANEKYGATLADYQKLGERLALEREAVNYQQQATANQARAGAAGKGWEQTLRDSLQALDKVAFGYERVETVTKRLTGTITAGGVTVQLFDEVRQLPGATDKAANAAEDLASAYGRAKAQASALLGIAERLAKVPAARWAGGGAEPGVRYQVNELGQESFLSAGGGLSLITAPAYGTWSPPVRGTVLPAGITSRLQQAGALPGGSRGAAGAPGAPGIPGAPGGVVATPALALHRLQGSIDRLQATMAAYDPRLEVHLPGNAGLLTTLQGFR